MMSKQSAYIFFSVACLLYSTIAWLGVTGSYLQAISNASTCWVFWWLGKQCAIERAHGIGGQV